MSRRYKPVGWRGEPYRHYLAAKGIKTKYNRLLYSSRKDTSNDFGVFRENPGGEWLEREKRIAQARGTDGPVTAGSQRLPVGVDMLMELPGENDEHTRMNSPKSREKIEILKKSIREKGFDEDDGPLVFVRPDGSAVLAEGNHRVRAAKELGLETIPVQFRYFVGAENVDGVWNLQNVVERARGFQ